jgi:hypothetical protein
MISQNGYPLRCSQRSGLGSKVSGSSANGVALLQRPACWGCHTLPALAHVQRRVADCRALLLRSTLERWAWLGSVETCRVLHAPISWSSRGRRAWWRRRHRARLRAVCSHTDLVLRLVPSVADSGILKVRGGPTSYARDPNKSISLDAPAVSVRHKVDTVVH